MVFATEAAPARAAPPEGPRFGPATATFVVVSSVIGTGVLTTPGFTAYFVRAEAFDMPEVAASGSNHCRAKSRGRMVFFKALSRS
jgi:hypothetical protein